MKPLHKNIFLLLTFAMLVFLTDFAKAAYCRTTCYWVGNTQYCRTYCY